ncbi:helix-turn-helix transcriptional regulator [Geoalkalibacter halelectricus]|uniref:Helix-turn-helix transcriptional regulator n=1 Tax=Geoalkalibacter halelectricus TaxID=2847045 RepID=A0ABY5ZJG8_9BACT|nr:helix-turn-helix transcriptional regulator [Geoalkalibacter halelectricus]UWZ79273.1 helix-turn-helix transcriptional regulator [Geoalkalibacter halelectricus]
MKAQIIEKNGKPEYAVIPYEDYLRMLAQIEDKVDAQAVAEFHENYVAGREQLVPAEILRRELEGESPIKLWREHRGLIQQELADRVGISKPYLSQIESGKRQGTIETLSAIARALDVSLELLTD